LTRREFIDAERVIVIEEVIEPDPMMDMEALDALVAVVVPTEIEMAITSNLEAVAPTEIEVEIMNSPEATHMAIQAMPNLDQATSAPRAVVAYVVPDRRMDRGTNGSRKERSQPVAQRATWDPPQMTKSGSRR